MKKTAFILLICLVSISFVSAISFEEVLNAIFDEDTKITGNLVKEECIGTARPCSELGKNNCGDSRDLTQFGCRWSEADSTCKGIAWPCDGVRIKDKNTCEQQRGCRWKVTDLGEEKPDYPDGALFQGESVNISGYILKVRYFLLNRVNAEISSPDSENYIKWLREDKPRKAGDAVVTLVDSGTSTKGRWAVIELYTKLKEPNLQVTTASQDDCGGQTGSHSCGSVHYCAQAGSPPEQKNYIDMAGDEGVKNKVNTKGWTAKLIDPYIGGYIQYQGKAGQSNMQTKPDRCAGNKFLFETYCLNDGGNTKYEWHQTKIECPSGYECQEVNELGACVKVTEKECTLDCDDGDKCTEDKCVFDSNGKQKCDYKEIPGCRQENECTTDDECTDEDLTDCNKPACVTNADGVKKCVQNKRKIAGCGDECTQHSDCAAIKCKEAICDDQDNDGKKSCRYEDDTDDPDCIKDKVCTDTDSGAAAEPIKKGKYINFQKIGTAEGYFTFNDGKRWVKLTDECKNKNTKIEYYCVDDKNIKTKTEKCDKNEKCFGGECIQDTCYSLIEEILAKHGIKF